MGLAPRVLLRLILGALGGAAAWLCTDFIFHPTDDPLRMLRAGMGLNFMYGACLGLFIGLSLSLADGLGSGFSIRLNRALIRGALAGFVGGGIGLNIGNIVYANGGGNPVLRGGGIGDFLFQCLIRAIGWMFFGGLLGFLYGILDAGPVKGRNGLIGGSIGGLLGGILFNPLAYAVPAILPDTSGRVSRLVAIVAVGAFIGFFTALVAELLKTQWVMVVYGRNEGREIILDKDISRIGRYELAEIPIFKDRLLAANHAEIRRQNGRSHLVDGGSAVGSSVNGKKVVEPVLLKDSDLIQVGNTQIVFYERATAGPVRRQVDLSRAAPAAPPLAPEGTCAFCGQRKDPITGACACSIPAGSVSTGGPAPYAAAPVPSLMSSAPLNGLRLTCLSGPHAGETYSVSSAGATIGRAETNSIPLVRDTTVSRSHATLSLQGGQYVLADPGSSNGTKVNGQRIAGSSPLRPGDEVDFGTARFRVEG